MANAKAPVRRNRLRRKPKTLWLFGLYQRLLGLMPNFALPVWKGAEQWRVVFWGGVLCLSTGSLGAGAMVASDRLLGDFVISRVEVEGDFVHLRPGDVQQRVEALLVNERSSGDLALIQDQLSAKPWVADARVRRVWPDALVIEIVEQRPVARWNQDQFLGMQGDLFEPASVPSLSLPELAGPTGMEREVFNRYQTWFAQLNQRGLELRALSFDVHKGWRMRTASGLEIQLGRLQLDQRLARFDQAWQLRLANTPDIKRIDLRYTNGLALVFEEASNG